MNSDSAEMNNQQEEDNDDDTPSESGQFSSRVLIGWNFWPIVDEHQFQTHV